MNERRVVITAASAITPIGHTREAIVRSLVQGISGVKPLRDDGLLTRHIHSQVFGTVDYPLEFDFKRSYRKTMGPVAYYACQVAKEALAQSSLPDEVKQEAANEIEGAQLQVKKEEPDKPQMAGKLKSATEALEESSKTFESAVKIGNMLGKAILWCGVQWAAWRYGR